MGEIFKNAKFDPNISKVNGGTSFLEIQKGNNGESWTYESKLTKNTYTYPNGKDENNLLLNLSNDTTNMERVEINPDKTSEERWTKIIWKTAAYDFKSKRFKCTKVGYSSEGRVNEICFEEVGKK